MGASPAPLAHERRSSALCRPQANAISGQATASDERDDAELAERGLGDDRGREAGDRAGHDVGQPEQAAECVRAVAGRSLA